VVAPGFVETDMTAELDEKRREENGIHDSMHGQCLVVVREYRNLPLEYWCPAEDLEWPQEDTN
jgi:hypothetical protein